jgi:16S rRNA (guanine1207-N2)-methyltransferase
VQPLSQFIARNARVFDAAAQLLWINPPGDAPWRDLQRTGAGLRLFCQDRADFSRLEAAGAQPVFGAFVPSGEPPPDGILLTLPKEKDRLRMLVQAAAALLPADGRLWLAGENQAGIRSAGQYLEERFGKVQKLDSARHCGLYQTSAPIAGTQFDPEAWRRQWTLERPAGPLNIHSWPGVFSHGALDVGTALLLEHLTETRPGQRVLDFGCGAGVVAAALLQTQPELQCVLSDSSALALHASRATLQANDLHAEIIASDGLTEVPGEFDLVISNPPWHQRHIGTPELGVHLLAGVRQRLQPGGTLLVVVNRHLPWPRWLDEWFGSHQVVSSAGGYQVLRAREPVRRARVH